MSSWCARCVCVIDDTRDEHAIQRENCSIAARAFFNRSLFHSFFLSLSFCLSILIVCFSFLFKSKQIKNKMCETCDTNDDGVGDAVVTQRQSYVTVVGVF